MFHIHCIDHNSEMNWEMYKNYLYIINIYKITTHLNTWYISLLRERQHVTDRQTDRQTDVLTDGITVSCVNAMNEYGCMIKTLNSPNDHCSDMTWQCCQAVCRHDNDHYTVHRHFVRKTLRSWRCLARLKMPDVRFWFRISFCCDVDSLPDVDNTH